MSLRPHSKELANKYSVPLPELCIKLNECFPNNGFMKEATMYWLNATEYNPSLVHDLEYIAIGTGLVRYNTICAVGYESEHGEVRKELLTPAPTAQDLLLALPAHYANPRYGTSYALKIDKWGVAYDDGDGNELVYEAMGENSPNNRNFADTLAEVWLALYRIQMANKIYL